MEVIKVKEPSLSTTIRVPGDSALLSSEYSETLSFKHLEELQGQNMSVGQNNSVGQNASMGSNNTMGQNMSMGSNNTMGQNMSMGSNNTMGQGLDVSIGVGRSSLLSKENGSVWLLPLDTISEDYFLDHEINDGSQTQTVVMPHPSLPLPSPMVKFPRHTGGLNLNLTTHPFNHTPRGGRGGRTGLGGGGVGGGYGSGRSSLSSSPYPPHRSAYPSPLEREDGYPYTHTISVRGLLSRSTSASFDYERGPTTTNTTPTIGSTSSFAVHSLTSHPSHHHSALPSPLEPSSLGAPTVTGRASLTHISRFSFDNDHHTGADEGNGELSNHSIDLPTHQPPHEHEEPSVSQGSNHDLQVSLPLSNKGKYDHNNANGPSHILFPTSPTIHDQIIALMEKYQPLFVCSRNSVDPGCGAVITNHDPVLVISIIDTTTTTTSSTPSSSNPPSRTPSRSASIEYTWVVANGTSSGHIINALGMSGGRSEDSLEVGGGSVGVSGTNSVNGGSVGGGSSAGSSLRPEGLPRFSSIVLTPGITPGE